MTSSTMTTKWAIYGPQTNQLSGRIFTHNLGNSPIEKELSALGIGLHTAWRRAQDPEQWH